MKMYKKITLAEAGNILGKYDQESINKFMEKIESFIPELPKENKPVLATRFYKDGKNMRHCYCPVCGNEWDEEDSYYYSWSYTKEPRCKACSNYKMQQVTGSFSTTLPETLSAVVEVNKTNGYIVMMYFDPSYKYDMNNKEINECLDSGNWDFLKGSFVKITENIHPKFLIYMLDKGFRVQQYNSLIFSPASSESYNAINKILSSKVININTEEAKEMLKENDVDVSCGSIIDILKQAQNSIQEKKEKVAAKRVRKPNEEATLYANYEPKKINKKEMLQKGTSSLALLKSQIGSKSIYLRYCPHCGKVTEGEVQNYSFICPECNNESKLSGYGSNRGTSTCATTYLEIFELMDETNNLIIRLFEIQETLDIEGNISFEVKETDRFYYTEKKILVFKANGTTWTKGTVYDLDTHSWGNKETRMQSEEEIKEILDQSSLKYSGVAEAWGLTDIPAICPLGDHSRDSYLYLWYKKPCMEQLLKTGLYNATQDVLKMNMDQLWRYVDVSATSVYSILKITKPVFKMARQMNLDVHAIAYLKKLWEFDNTITVETYKKIKELGSIDAIYDIASRYHIPFTKIIEYVESCYNNQCIQKSETIRLWADYLRMAKDMTYRLDNKNTKFPQSLKKEHDRATFAYRVVQNEINQKRFKEQAVENAKYEYSFEKLFVKVPKTPEEIIEEGTNQKHCVASYVNRVREGDTVVAFIRFKETPDDSYFTIEIKDDVVVQVKGYTNSAPTDKKLLEFLDKFAKAKNLKLKY